MVMIRPGGKPSRIYENIFALMGKKPKKFKESKAMRSYLNTNNSKLQSRDYALNPRERMGDSGSF